MSPIKSSVYVTDSTVRFNSCIHTQYNIRQRYTNIVEHYLVVAMRCV